MKRLSRREELALMFIFGGMAFGGYAAQVGDWSVWLRIAIGAMGFEGLLGAYILIWGKPSWINKQQNDKPTSESNDSNNDHRHE